MKGYSYMNITKYNKSDIIKKASYNLNIPKDELKVIFDSFIECIADMLKEPKDRIHLEMRKFGSFDIYPSNPRTNARNPLSKEKVVIPARKKITFKPSKNIKDEIYKARIIE